MFLRKITIRLQNDEHFIKSREELTKRKEEIQYKSSRKVYQQLTTDETDLTLTHLHQFEFRTYF